MYRKLMLLLTVVVCLGIWGCFRPQETITTLIVKAGLPLIILGDEDGKPSVKVKAQQFGSDKIIKEQEIQGWVAMPEEHWNATKEKIKELEDALSAATKR